MIAALLALCAGCTTDLIVQTGVRGSRSAETVCEFTREPEPEGLSGITRISGDRYHCVDDRGGLLHEVEVVMSADGEVATLAVKRSVKLEGRVDLEDCAYDPLDGFVWVVDEHDSSVRQFDPMTGRETASVTMPDEFVKQTVPNRSLESITISQDGMRMYVANEDTLKCDGSLADNEHGGVVRIQEFVRVGKGAPWMRARQFRYRTERVEGEKFNGTSMSGVVSLCAPGDGSLLVLEREMSCKNPLFPSFRARLFEVLLDDAKPELDKRSVWDEDTMFSNYEGICLGPELKDGSRSLLLISDGGSSADKSLLVLSLR